MRTTSLFAIALAATTYPLGPEGIERYQPRSIFPVILIAE